MPDDQITVDLADVRSGWKFIGMAAAICVPAVLLRSGLIEISVEVDTLLFGLAILGAAFLLSWGAEVAQLEISQALAIAFLAFIAVLPEYAVDLVFAWKAGTQDRLQEITGVLPPTCPGQARCRELAIANMTGANRLLIGLGWAVVVLVWWKRSGEKQVTLAPRRRIELGFLFLATLWAFTIVLREQISMLDMVVLLIIFVAYIWHAAIEESEHPEIMGPPVAIAVLPKRRRRLVTIGMFLFAAGMILLSAEPFAHGLVETGRKLDVDEFLLVQWLAPLASEAPEMIIAILFVLRAKPAAGLGTLVSSKVNQWSLLIATIPLVYAIAHGSLSAMPLDAQQVEEVFLTAAQSAFAVGVLASLSISRAEAIMLLVPFLAQFGFPSTTVRYGFSFFYLAGFVFLLVRRRESRAGLVRAVRAAFSIPRREA